MRATTRTMWLLLSLSFLFVLSVCSDVTTTSVSNNNSSIAATNTSVTTTATTTTATITTATITNAATTTATITNAATTTATITNAATTTPTTTKTEQWNTSMQATTTQLKNAVISSTINVATSRSTDTPAHTSKPPSTSKQSISDTTTAAATSTTTLLKGTTITANPVTSPKALTTQMPEGSGTSKTLGSKAPVRPDKGETTEIPKNLTVAPTQPSTGQGSMISTAITTNPSQGDGERVPSTTEQADSKADVTEARTVRNTSNEQTTPTPPVTTVHIGIISSPHNLTKTGDYPATGTSGTTDGTSPLPAAITSTTAAAQQETFLFSLNSGHMEGERKDLVEVCRRVMVNFQGGNCTLTLQHSTGKTQINGVEIFGSVNPSVANQYHEEITKVRVNKPTDNKTLIAILASCGALLIMIVILAVCASHHRKPFNENQQHLTEELHTVENGYHDNPTLEVMEVQPEMQEKKTPLNREFNDSWIVPFDNLLKEDIADEEDTHL